MSNVADTDETRKETVMRKVILVTAALAVASLGSAQIGFAKDKDKDKPKPSTAAPEIDPSSAMSALTLLAGGLAIIRARRKIR
jgi:hypothetical protein